MIMFIQNLFNRIDNGTHPIVVRQMRRLVRSHTITWTTLLFLIIPVGLIFVLNFLDNEISGSGFKKIILDTVIVSWANIFISITAFCPALMYASAKINDEFFDQMFNWRELLSGYVLISILFAGYYVVLALPFISVTFLLGGKFFIPILMLLLQLTVGVIRNIVFLTFLIRVQTRMGLIITAVLIYLFHTTPLVVLGIVETMVVFVTRSAGSLSSNFPMQVYSYLMWLFAGVIAILLFRYHFLHHRYPMWEVVCINILVYSFFTGVMVILWLLLRVNGLIS
ncbi:MAG: hypothetical protein LBT09_09645 [Planctomycetaceae bacterium]|jgi:hypothetical protein|nr:hypothetical protein [Planctomycetaceae bacterium]